MKKWPKFSYFALKKNFQGTIFSEKTDLAFPPSKRAPRNSARKIFYLQQKSGQI